MPDNRSPPLAASPSTSRQIYSTRPDPQAVAVQTTRPDSQLNDITDDDLHGGGPASASHAKDGSTKHKEKIGHRRTDREGGVTYKRVPTNNLMGAIQMGISNSIGSLAHRKMRDILVQDFDLVEMVAFPSEGSATTPSHNYGDFRFKTFAPLAFRYFRDIFHIQAADFLNSLCTQPLKELSNPGASGSVFYVSADDKFIVKTVQHKEADFLCKLLPGYYMNLQQNPRTMLPKFFGLFCYQSLGKNIRLIVMNNLLPQSIHMHHKFDLKGSTYKRYASRAERAKASPTLKDLDFNEEYPNGITLDPKTYDILMDIVKRDCLVLESFKIMDYSFLIGIHNIDLEAGTAREDEDQAPIATQEVTSPSTDDLQKSSEAETERKEPISARTEAWRALQLDFNAPKPSHETGGVPARNHKGERLLLFLGVIDILQSYRLFKKLEHTWKSILHDGDSISVHNPSFYAERFQGYIATKVFVRAEAQFSRHPNKFRSIVHSYLAIKQNPQRHVRNKSIPEGEEPKENEPLMSQRNTDRRSHFKSSDSEKRKKMDRLFASPDESSSSKTPVDGTITTADPSDTDPHRTDRPLEYSDIQLRLD
ncbi:unnamed protein product [Bursaphelenchus okinawaensis]|uniref:PIPK domain-containing protein n=1 Tax=Bursaphelenchus okinawaensis TaxID=465554 RepID=A0A811JVK8_9BILA|nr:unnamed protein product [Bursaphelenchus okinawaensis]CAG9085306.1 unnamed protein product [Bursaphelenchus okinawaensis]